MKQETKLTKFQVIIYSLANLPLSLVLLSVGTWLMPLYCPSPDEKGAIQYVNPELYGIILFLIMIPAAFADPIVGYLSDRTHSRLGRRFPYILYGLPLLVISFIALWFPPILHTSLTNAVYLTITSLLFYLAFTAVANPYLSLMPEITTDPAQRVSISAWMAGFGTLGQAAEFVLFGMLITAFAGGKTISGIHIPDGYKVAGIIGGLLLVAAVLPLFFYIKETPHSASKEVPFSFIEAAVATLKNSAFISYVGPLSIAGGALALVQIAVRYLVKVILFKGDDLVGWLLLGLTFSTILFYPVATALGHKFTKKHLFLSSLILLGLLLPSLVLIWFLPSHFKLTALWVSVILLGAPLAMFTALQPAILADVMDMDTNLTGFQREAMYTGMQGFIQKIGWGLAPLSQGILFKTFGYTHAHPWGILLAPLFAGILCLGAGVWFLYYPIDK